MFSCLSYGFKLKASQFLEYVAVTSVYKLQCNILDISMTSDVLTAVRMSVLIFSVVTPCGLISDHHSFGGKNRLHLQDEDGSDSSPKSW